MPSRGLNFDRIILADITQWTEESVAMPGQPDITQIRPAARSPEYAQQRAASVASSAPSRTITERLSLGISSRPMIERASRALPPEAVPAQALSAISRFLHALLGLGRAFPVQIRLRLGMR